jgi:hypothetical protein
MNINKMAKLSFSPMIAMYAVLAVLLVLVVMSFMAPKEEGFAPCKDANCCRTPRWLRGAIRGCKAFCSC